ncbi:hypothetical protein HJD18_07460 [Thermoleophilia bacterium SCSIO 60948]|nr:hypothetical protein HJD18_07460 [Thermoleophilia bacterium SCSIO 60948]
MFASDNTSFQRLLDGVDLMIDATTLGEYGLETATDQRPVGAQDGAPAPRSECAESARTRRRRLTRRKRSRRPSGTTESGVNPYSFDFPPSPAGEPIVVGPFRIAARAQAPLMPLAGGRRLTRLG